LKLIRRVSLSVARNFLIQCLFRFAGTVYELGGILSANAGRSLSRGDSFHQPSSLIVLGGFFIRRRPSTKATFAMVVFKINPTREGSQPSLQPMVGLDISTGLKGGLEK
jgi:hypothetical protein